jgi:hypothetical protein
VNGSYRFKVLAGNDAGTTDYGPWMFFSVSSVLPVAPTLLAPLGTINTKTPQYRWGEVTGATKYYLEVLKKATGIYPILTDVLPTVCSSGVCTYTPFVPLSSGSYAFRMKTYNAAGSSDYSDWMVFKVP